MALKASTPTQREVEKNMVCRGQGRARRRRRPQQFLSAKDCSRVMPTSDDSGARGDRE